MQKFMQRTRTGTGEGECGLAWKDHMADTGIAAERAADIMLREPAL